MGDKKFESRVFPEGTQTGDGRNNHGVGLRAVYFQRGLKRLNGNALCRLSLRAVYFQRGLKLERHGLGIPIV